MSYKQVTIIVSYRIPETYSNNVFTVKAQLDKYQKKIKTLQYYHKQILNDLIVYIDNLPETSEIIIAGDFNESVDSEEIQQFLIRNRLMEVHTVLNGDYHRKKDSTYKKGKNMINFVAASTTIIEYIDGSLITNYNKILIIDHRRFIIDVQLEEYLIIEGNTVDELDTRKLNLWKMSH